MRCLVSATVDDPWASLQTDGGTRFLKFIPYLADTPNEMLTSPDEANVVAGFDSEANRIVASSTIRSLVKVCKDVYMTHSVTFHWDLSSIEERQDRSYSQNETAQKTVPQTQIGTESSKYKYVQNSFVATRAHEAGQGLHFWVGEILEVHPNRNKQVKKLTVRWHANKPGNDVFSSA